MPKLKTHKGAAKRFKRTGNGKIKRQHAHRNHNLGHKRQKRKRRLRKSTTVDSTEHKKIDRLLPK